jgi:hypothetical protein
VWSRPKDPVDRGLDELQRQLWRSVVCAEAERQALRLSSAAEINRAPSSTIRRVADASERNIEALATWLDQLAEPAQRNLSKVMIDHTSLLQWLQNAPEQRAKLTKEVLKQGQLHREPTEEEMAELIGVFDTVLVRSTLRLLAKRAARGG